MSWSDADSSTGGAALMLAAAAVRDADALVVAAGAGMGVDSGLPDFRGARGFWKAYPSYQKQGLHFQHLANPSTFATDPHLAWGFYGHRLNLYRATQPHRGFQTLLKWAASKPGGCFAFTSNVDGHFQAAGFPPGRVAECHGSIHHLQCTVPCSDDIWSADGVEVRVGEDLRASDPLPRCPRCGALARPNILMFGDPAWVPDRSDEQQSRYHRWLDEQRNVNRRRVAVIECGAGTAIPTVRHQSEVLSDLPGVTLVRINPREPHGPGGTISLPTGALEAIDAVDALLGGSDPPG